MPCKTVVHFEVSHTTIETLLHCSVTGQQVSGIFSRVLVLDQEQDDHSGAWSFSGRAVSTCRMLHPPEHAGERKMNLERK